MLRPIERLSLGEHQLVSVVILDDPEEATFASADQFEAMEDHSVSLEAVRQALSPIPGSREDDFSTERNER